MEMNFYQRFFKSSKKNLMDVFKILRLSANDFQVRQKEKTTTLKETQADLIF